MNRVYFARAMDGLDSQNIIELAQEVEKELLCFNLYLVDPFQEVTVDRGEDGFEDNAERIVEADLALLRTVDAVLMDCSIPNRNYVGCICELVYAYLWDIPTVVYVGSSGNERRYWLHYHATGIYQTRQEAISALVSFLTAD